MVRKKSANRLPFIPFSYETNFCFMWLKYTTIWDKMRFAFKNKHTRRLCYVFYILFESRHLRKQKKMRACVINIVWPSSKSTFSCSQSRIRIQSWPQTAQSSELMKNLISIDRLRMTTDWSTLTVAWHTFWSVLSGFKNGVTSSHSKARCQAPLRTEI